jgi:DNA-binding MarR family transcriptional regulator
MGGIGVQDDHITALDAAKGESLAIGRLKGLLGFHLRLASSAIYQDFMAVTSDLALTPKQFSVLELIAANPGSSQIDIAGRLGMDRATMMALTNRLEARTLIFRTQSTTDRRRQELNLTAEGAAMLEQAYQLIIKHEQGFLSRFSETEKKALYGYLHRIYGGAIDQT